MYKTIKQRFMDYINSMPFSPEQQHILDNLKLSHTNRVVGLSETLATSVFSSNDYLSECINLAKITALLHDVARWNQMFVYNNFTDIEGDHGEMGADIVLQNDMLNGLGENNKQIILTAIREHNKKYANSHDEFTQVFVDIIRDADKIDNLHIEVENYSDKGNSMKNVLPFSDEHRLSPQIYENVMNDTLADSKDRETKIDFKFFKMI